MSAFLKPKHLPAHEHAVRQPWGGFLSGDDHYQDEEVLTIPNLEHSLLQLGLNCTLISCKSSYSRDNHNLCIRPLFTASSSFAESRHPLWNPQARIISVRALQETRMEADTGGGGPREQATPSKSRISFKILSFLAKIPPSKRWHGATNDKDTLTQRKGCARPPNEVAWGVQSSECHVGGRVPPPHKTDDNNDNMFKTP